MDDLIKDFTTVRCVFWTATKLEETSIERLKEHMLKKYSWIAQVEHGKNGTNEHLHFLQVNGPKETYNARNTLKKVLFPEDVKRGVVIDERRLKAVTVTNTYAFLYYCGYMLKESESFMYISDDLPTIDDIRLSLKKHEAQIAETMEGFSKLSTRKEQHAASSCARYRILCEKYQLPLSDYVDLFNALEADGIDTQWMLKDKFLLFEYISLKTQSVTFSRSRIHQQMKQHGYLEDITRPSVGYPPGQSKPVLTLAGYRVSNSGSEFISPITINPSPNGDTPVSQESKSSSLSREEETYFPPPNPPQGPAVYRVSAEGSTIQVKNKTRVRV